MITPVVMPQMGLEVTEGVVAAIHVAPGATVAEGDALVELETDKALTDVVAPRDGVVQSIDVELGDTVELGATLVVLADADDGEPAATATATTTAAPASPVPAAPPQPARAAETPDGRLRAAPVARRAAEQLGVSLADVAGTGPRGRITLADVERAAAEPAANGGTPAPADAPPAGRVEPMTPTRRAVARRMAASQLIPQFALWREIEATWLLGERERMRADGAGVSVNDLLVQALAETVSRHPGLAASYVEPEEGGAPQLSHRDDVDVGLAVATERGLLVPVLRGAHRRSLRELASERTRLVAAARSGRIALEDMGGATITLSSLAGFGIDSFAAMLNPGESAILAVGRPVERVVPRERGVAIVPMLSLGLTIDHRVLDGASGGAALVELADLLEGGMAWRP